MGRIYFTTAQIAAEPRQSHPVKALLSVRPARRRAGLEIGGYRAGGYRVSREAVERVKGGKKRDRRGWEERAGR